VLGVKVWRRLLGVDDRAVIERVEFDEEADAVVAYVRARRLRKHRCGRCGKRAPGYDQGEGRRRWRALDLGEVRSFLEAEAPGVDCPEHGPTVIQFPWARHAAGHTSAFDDTVAWLAVHTSKTAVVELVRIAWATVGAIIARVVDEARSAVDPFDELRRIGIDEISYKRPPLPHRGRRPRHRPAGVGGQGPRQGNPGGVLRRPGRRALRGDPPGQRRRGGMDRRGGRRPL
jgi:transposase